jgi:hypothetical protein
MKNPETLELHGKYVSAGKIISPAGCASCRKQIAQEIREKLEKKLFYHPDNKPSWWQEFWNKEYEK